MLHSRDGEVPSTEVARLVVGDVTGSSFVFKPMPWQSIYVGRLLVIDERTLALNVYDVETSSVVLMQTKDLGDTWNKRATIYKNVPTPVPNDATLQRFAVTVALRKNGFPANATPGAPWLSDYLKPLPWEI